MRRQKKQVEEVPELTETCHLRRTNMPSDLKSEPPVEQQVHLRRDVPIERRSFRKKISASLDNIMKIGFLGSRARPEEQKKSVERHKSFRDNLRSGNQTNFNGRGRIWEKPVYEVQHNNSSRLRINHISKKILEEGDNSNNTSKAVKQM